MEMIKLLKPNIINSNKIRLGPPEDGGYVINEIVLDNCSVLMTYGVGHEIRYEQEFAAKYNKPTYMFDHTLGRDAWEDGNIKFIPDGLGIGNGLKEVKEHCLEFGITGNVFLKIDIEGYEYEYFKKTDVSEIANLAIGLILEVHWIDNNDNRNDLITILTEIEKYFVLTHIHGNNWGGEWEYNGVTMPKVLELSFVNKKIAGEYSIDDNDYPITNLDIPNNPNLADYALNFLKM